MSGYNNGYGQSGQQGYGQYNPYGQPNPYNQRDNEYSQQQQGYSGQSQGYGQQSGYDARPELQHQASSQYNEERAQGGYEMTSVNGQSNDPNRILNEIRSIDREIDGVESTLFRLKELRKRFLNDPTPDPSLVKEINSINSNIMNSYRGLVDRVRRIKQNPESGNPRNAPQVGKVDRRLKSALNQAQKDDRDYRQDNKEQMARQYRIVRPDASEQEIREATEDPNNTQVFSQALISSTRRGDATLAAKNVRSRHEAIQQIEKDMVELAQLFNDLEVLVEQQGVAVVDIEQKGEQVTDHVVKANTELTGAVDKARAARKKKWICLGIGLAIIIVIAIVVALAVYFTQRR